MTVFKVDNITKI